MLTESEMGQISQIYRISCKWVTIPFTMKNRKLIPTKRNTCWNYLAGIFVVFQFGLRLSRIPFMNSSSGVNGTVLRNLLDSRTFQFGLQVKIFGYIKLNLVNLFKM